MHAYWYIQTISLLFVCEIEATYTMNTMHIARDTVATREVRTSNIAIPIIAAFGYLLLLDLLGLESTVPDGVLEAIVALGLVGGVSGSVGGVSVDGVSVEGVSVGLSVGGVSVDGVSVEGVSVDGVGVSVEGVSVECVGVSVDGVGVSVDGV